MADYGNMHKAKLIHNIDIKENLYEADTITDPWTGPFHCLVR